jgi:hypothetical protein
MEGAAVRGGLKDTQRGGNVDLESDGTPEGRQASRQAGRQAASRFRGRSQRQLET